MALLYGRAGYLTDINGGFRRGQFGGDAAQEEQHRVWVDIFAILQHAVDGAGWEHGGTQRDLQLLTAVVAKAKAVILVAEPPQQLALDNIKTYFEGTQGTLDKTVSRQIPFMRVWCLEELRCAKRVCRHKDRHHQTRCILMPPTAGPRYWRTSRS
jgi:hypothetical protein